jgi:hypothetical protein
MALTVEQLEEAVLYLEDKFNVEIIEDQKEDAENAPSSEQNEQEECQIIGNRQDFRSQRTSLTRNKNKTPDLVAVKIEENDNYTDKNETDLAKCHHGHNCFQIPFFSTSLKINSSENLYCSYHIDKNNNYYFKPIKCS